jgi:glycogen operon protein
MNSGDWADQSALAIGIYLDGSDDPDRAEDGTLLVDDDFLVLVNAWWDPLDFTLPNTRPGARWRAEIDTHNPGSEAGDRGAGDGIQVGPRSVMVLTSPRPHGT